MPEIRVDGGFYGAPASQSQMMNSQISQAEASNIEAPSFAAVHTSTPPPALFSGSRVVQSSQQPIAGPSLQRVPTAQNSFSNVRARQSSYQGPSQQQRGGPGPTARTLSRSRSHPSPIPSQGSQRSGTLRRESIIQTIRASQAMRPVEEDLNVSDLKRQLEQVCAQRPPTGLTELISCRPASTRESRGESQIGGGRQ